MKFQLLKLKIKNVKNKFHIANCFSFQKRVKLLNKMPFPIFGDEVKFHLCKTIKTIIDGHVRRGYPMNCKSIREMNKDYLLVGDYRFNMKYTTDKRFLRLFLYIKNDYIRVYDVELKDKLPYGINCYQGTLTFLPEFKTYGYPLFIKDGSLTYDGPVTTGNLTKSVR